MAKSLLKIEARRLRTVGGSIKDIAHQLKVSQSTASLWCRDITLSPEQTVYLLQSKENKITAGRLRGAYIQRKKREIVMQMAEKNARVKLRGLTNGAFFTAGLALYLGEGSKTTPVVEFTNSNPKIVNFMLRWFKKFYKVGRRDIRFSLLLNASYQNQEIAIKKRWMTYLRIATDQFTKTRLSYAHQEKKYQNSTSYNGTINFRLRKSSKILYELKAYMDRLLEL